MKAEPLAGYVILKQQEAEKKTKAGIFIAESAMEKPVQGTVMAVGADVAIQGGGGLVMASPVKIGDVVIYKKWGGDDIKIDGEEFKLVKFEDLMAIVREDQDAA